MAINPTTALSKGIPFMLGMVCLSLQGEYIRVPMSICIKSGYIPMYSISILYLQFLAGPSYCAKIVIYNYTLPIYISIAQILTCCPGGDGVTAYAEIFIVT